jgi:hypothetical protein
MLMWFHRAARETVLVYKTPDGERPERVGLTKLDPKYKKDSICFRGFLRATGIRLRVGDLVKMDWADKGEQAAVTELALSKRETVRESPHWIRQVLKDIIDEYFIGPKAPATALALMSSEDQSMITYEPGTDGWLAMDIGTQTYAYTGNAITTSGTSWDSSGTTTVQWTVTNTA